MLRLMVFCLVGVLFGGAEGRFRRISCEGQQLTINCGSKEIDILSASYGRTKQGVCGHNGNTNCHSGISMKEVMYDCQGQPRCTLHAKNSAFGDPCRGTHKYLEVIYNCVYGSRLYGLLIRVCEHNTHAIHCHGSKRIKILYANYGRLTGLHICPYSWSATSNCGAAGSLRIVRNDCQGKRSCVLYAHNGKYGDPCRGEMKYLEVRYKCE